MKKFLFIIVFIMLIVLVGCTAKANYETQTIVLKDSGTFKVPVEWKCYEKDNLMYFVDTEGNPIMIQHHSFASYSDIEMAPEAETEVNDFFKIKAIELLESEVFSNSSSICKTKWLINGATQNKFEICFSYNTNNADSPYHFIVIDDSLSKEDLEIIANSYLHFE